MDSQARAEDLAAAILSATAPPQIAAACSSIDNFLRRHPADQIRPFFSLALPALLCRLFGFDDSSSSSFSRFSAPTTAWIDCASADPANLASLLFDLLSPGGILLSSIAAVDRHALVRFVFPNERLPEWIRWALQSDRSVSAISDLCSFLKGRVTEDPATAKASGGGCCLELNLFEYYMMWFAYYPVCKGNSESATEGQSLRKSSRNRFRLENWTSSFLVLSSTGRRQGQTPECSLYLRLLYAYLQAFVPKDGLGSCQPYRSSLLHYSMISHDTAFLQAECLVHTFVHFWMVDNDFSPFPVDMSRSCGLLLPNRAMLCETPPTPGLGDVLMLLVKYLNSGGGNAQIVSEKSSARKETLDDARSRNMMLSSSSLVGSWTTVIQRPLYRFIVRSFLYCPVGASIKNASQVFDLWTTYMEPWKLSLKDFAAFEQSELQNLTSATKIKCGKSNTQNGEHQKERRYSNIWQNYVLLNYMFYSSLVVHFIGFAHKFLHANADLLIPMVLKVLNILTSSRDLLDLLRKVDLAYYSKPVSPSFYSANDAYKYLPSIREQLLDWEDGLCVSDTDGLFLLNWSGEMKLFSDMEDGAHHLLQLFVLRAEHETRLASGDGSDNIQALNSIRSQMNILFGGSSMTFQSAESGEAHDHHERGDVFTPKHPGVGQRTWADVKYKGDWMRRPISEYEVAWLARWLIRLSDWLNEYLSLDRAIDDPNGPIILDLSRDDEVHHVGGVKDALPMVLTVVGSWLAVLGLAVLRFMRSHQMRINLRPLASKKFVMLLALYIAVLLLKKFFYAAIEISHSL